MTANTRESVKNFVFFQLKCFDPDSAQFIYKYIAELSFRVALGSNDEAVRGYCKSLIVDADSRLLVPGKFEIVESAFFLQLSTRTWSRWGTSSI